jgi:CheY-like chemotaxis protein
MLIDTGSGAHARAKVLLVDDDDELRELVAEFVAECGLDVTTAARGDEAFERFVEHRPDLVISDVNMPGCDGMWLVRAIRALPIEQGGTTPILALSAACEWQGILSSGFDGCLQKPIHPERLLQVLGDFVARLAPAAITC